MSHRAAAPLERSLPLPAPLARVLGEKRAKRIGPIRRIYEAEVPPAEAFLRWALTHPDLLTWPKSAGSSALTYGAATQAKRRALLDGDCAVQAEALAELAAVGAAGSRRKWWAFEGFTSVDCLLETEKLLLLIEGKRTEPISASTTWFPRRNQIVRNAEVAQALAGSKNFVVLLCSEQPIELPSDSWQESLPHKTPAEIEGLQRHFLGCVTRPEITNKLCPKLTLPNTIEQAIGLLAAKDQ